MPDTKDLLPILYQRIADLTTPTCANGTGECCQFKERKYRCCERQYCEQARTFAKEKYDIDLQDTGNPDLPFMGETGCVVVPHLRPVCTLHVCDYSWSKEDHQGTEEYKNLREEILNEAKLQGKEPF